MCAFCTPSFRGKQTHVYLELCTCLSLDKKDCAKLDVHRSHELSNSVG